MGTGEFIRRGVAVQPVRTAPAFLIITGKFLPQNYAQKINTINAYWDRYSQLRQQKDLPRPSYLLTLVFVTMLIVFAATWIGFHLARASPCPSRSWPRPPGRSPRATSPSGSRTRPRTRSAS